MLIKPSGQRIHFLGEKNFIILRHENQYFWFTHTSEYVFVKCSLLHQVSDITSHWLFRFYWYWIFFSCLLNVTNRDTTEVHGFLIILLFCRLWHISSYTLNLKTRLCTPLYCLLLQCCNAVRREVRQTQEGEGKNNFQGSMGVKLKAKQSECWCRY